MLEHLKGLRENCDMTQTEIAKLQDMSQTGYREIVWTARFKKDYKLAIKRQLNIDLLDDVIRALSN